METDADRIVTIDDGRSRTWRCNHCNCCRRVTPITTATAPASNSFRCPECHHRSFLQNHTLVPDHDPNLVLYVFGRDLHRPTSYSSQTAKSFIDSLPIVTIADSDSDVCPICHEDFAPVEEIINQLPCRHVFHHKCIVGWLNQKNTCPVCRHEFPKERQTLLDETIWEIPNGDGSTAVYTPTPAGMIRTVRAAANRDNNTGFANVMLDEDGDTMMADA